VDGELTVVGLYGDTVNVYNTSTPASPSLKSTATMPSVVKRIDIRGNRVYAANHLKGLQIVDISDPNHASLTGSFPVSDNSYGADVAVWGDTAFTLHFNSPYPYMRVVDTSDPTALYPEISRLALGLSTDYQYGIKVKNQYAFVVDTDFRIIDVSDPETPFQVSLEPFAATGGYDVDIQGNFAYIAAGTDLYIIDITDYHDPELLYSNTQGTVKAIDVVGDYAYVVDGENLCVLDISDPTSIRSVSTIGIGSTGYDVVVQGEYCYVACGTAGWKVIDLFPWND